MMNILFARKLSSWGQKATTLAIATMMVAGGVFAPAQAKPDAKKAVAANYNPWNKLCSKAPKGKKKICVTRIDGLGGDKMIPYAPLAIEEIEGKEKSVVVTLPNIWLLPVAFKDKKTKKEVKSFRFVGARWGILTGVYLKVDENKVHKLRYVFCDQFGCVAQAKASKALIAEMKKGKKIIVAAQNGPKNMRRPFPLKGFGKALDGKASDPVAWNKRISAVRKQQIIVVQKYQRQEMKIARELQAKAKKK